MTGAPPSPSAQSTPPATPLAGGGAAGRRRPKLQPASKGGRSPSTPGASARGGLLLYHLVPLRRRPGARRGSTSDPLSPDVVSTLPASDASVCGGGSGASRREMRFVRSSRLMAVGLAVLLASEVLGSGRRCSAHGDGGGRGGGAGVGVAALVLIRRLRPGS